MRVFFLSFCLFCSVLLWTCQNIEDASPSSRNSFIKLYEGPYDITANSLEIIDNGYVIVGNMSVPPEGNAVDSVITVVIQTDKNGNQVGGFHTFEQVDRAATGKSIKHLSTGGYIIVGDRIKRDLNPSNVANGIIASARLLRINENFENPVVFEKADQSGNEIKSDFYGGSITLTDNRIIVLGTYVEGVGTQIGIPEKPFLISLTYNLVVDWQQTYDLIDRNYKNSRSVHLYNNRIIWASAIARTLGDVTFSYVSIPVVEPNSTFVNYSTLGENDDQLFIPRDIQPAKSPAFGYGVVGSYSEPNATDGSKSNMFFLRVNASGDIINGSARFYDAVLSENNVSIDSTLSEIKDEGEAITSTSDGGFVIAGSMETIPSKGNGAKDIFLVKIDAFGNTVWNRTIGGAGNEVVSSIKETADQGLLICGTNTLGNASTVFLIKTDKKGQLKN